MASVATEESSAGINFEGSSSGHQSGESFAEWRSSKQVENGTPSTSPPYWDSDDEDDGGPKPSDLYGKYTWKIEKFSELNKRELRSNVFDIGGYKWYILIYPQGCDVCNHLSLFLCVANHDKLLPGWSHFAQFTIAVVNKDPKKSKYSDTLHRFWKKEHDWGWKKFMEISKVYDGFIDADALIIKAQVQVIRERADRPFRCLDILYRRELVRIYIGNVEQICRCFVEERRGKIVKLIQDKARWLSFRTFWGAMDLSSRRAMSREKTEAILKVVVKHFFIEKEVSSTLVMDALYSGLKALEGQTKAKKSKSKYIEAESFLVPIIRIANDTFILVDDVLSLLAIAETELLTAKDDKGPQNRAKDGVAKEDFNKDSFERDERRLADLGRRTIEIFVLAHIFSKIEIAYQEAVALRKQEELIQEEAALLAGIEQKGKHGGADKEKKSKKKQGKQKRNNKGKDKGKDDKSSSHSQGKNEQSISPDERKDILAPEPEVAIEKSDAMEDISDAYDYLECVPEKTVPPDSEDSDTFEVPLPTEVTSVHNGTEGRSSSVMDDSSSACSSNSLSEVARRKSQNENLFYDKNQRSVSSGKNHQKNVASDSVDSFHVGRQCSSKAVHAVSNQFETYRRPQGVESLSGTAVSLSQDTVAQKEVKPASLAGKSSSISPTKSESKLSAANEVSTVKRSSKDNFKQANRSQTPANSVKDTSKLKPDTQKLTATPKPIEKSGEHRAQIAREKPPAQPVNVKTEKPLMSSVPILSRPSSAPVSTGSTGPRPVASSVSMVQPTPVLARSVSVAGRLGPEPSASSTQSYIPQSYRNAITGSPSNIGSISSYTQNQSTNSVVNGSLSYAQATSLASSPMIHPHSSDKIDTKPMMPSFSFGMANHHRDVMQNKPLWSEPTQRDNTRNIPVDHPSLLGQTQSFDLYNPFFMRPQHNFPSNLLAGISGRHGHVLSEEFPHLDIINDLLDEEHGIGRLSVLSDSKTQQTVTNGLQSMDLQFGFRDDVSSWHGPSASPSRFVRTGSYHDTRGLQHGYGALRSNFDRIHQVSQTQPSNEQTVGLLGSQWQLNGSALPYNPINAHTNGYTYDHVPEYQNLNIGTNGYNTVFRPANGL